jgi:hypothetical protein
VQTFDGNPKSVSAISNPAGLNVVVTYDGSATAPTNAGSYAVTATVNEPNFVGQASGTLIIQPATQQITFGALPNRTVGDADFNVSATASSNLAVSFSASGNCTLTGTQVHITAAAPARSRRRRTAMRIRTRRQPVARTFTIGKANQQITFDALTDKKFGDADFNVSATASSNLSVWFAANGNCTINGSTVHLTGAGQCTVTASQDGNADYNPAAPVAKTFAIAQSRSADHLRAADEQDARDADFNVSASSSSQLRSPSRPQAIARWSGRLVHLNGAGQCSITASQDGNADYNSAAPVFVAFSIGKAISRSPLTRRRTRNSATPTSTLTRHRLRKLTVSVTGLETAR